MTSLASKAGWLMIDHRASPGTRRVPEGKLLETAAYVCVHCNALVVKNQARTRERSVCLKCMAIQCDGCAALGECRPFMRQYMDRPGQIISTAGAPARSTDSLVLPNYYLKGSTL